MRQNISAIWTEQLVNQLIKLFNAGRSGSEISRQMSVETGIEITRNAVIGKIHRLRKHGLVGPAINQKHVAKVPAFKPRHFLARKPVRKPALAPVPPAVYPKPNSQHAVKVQDIGRNQCRYIGADFARGNGGEQFMCGAPTLEKKPYCSRHHALTTYAPAANRRFERAFLYFANRT
jgi:hypothetical protein